MTLTIVAAIAVISLCYCLWLHYSLHQAYLGMRDLALTAGRHDGELRERVEEIENKLKVR